MWEGVTIIAYKVHYLYLFFLSSILIYLIVIVLLI